MSLVRAVIVLVLSLGMWFCSTSAYPAQPFSGVEDSPSLLTNIDIEETTRSASIAFSIHYPPRNPPVDYKVDSSVRLARKWIDLVLPGVMTGIRGKVATGEKVLGDILVEQAPAVAGTRISIEILAIRINYVIRQENGLLVLNVTEQ